jgi:hypothetical protein
VEHNNKKKKNVPNEKAMTKSLDDSSFHSFENDSHLIDSESVMECTDETISMQSVRFLFGSLHWIKRKGNENLIQDR